jgi:antitoxin ParD1/3/4
MRSTRQFSITLPIKMADWVRQKASSGEYASESEVVREGLRALQERNVAVERWLRTEGIAAYDEYVVDPASAVSVEEAFDQALEELRDETPKQRA